MTLDAGGEYSEQAGPPAPPSLDYRPEIDGLRAIAVLVVLLYHAGFHTVRGGFVGVDVFFVLSGFLITRLVVSEIDEGTFTLRGFYARRIRRLGPALLFTCSLVLLVGALSLAPSHLLRLAMSDFHALVSSANFLFWNGTDYFDAETGLSPLLHMWSLSVEEQFYLVWPTLLALASLRGHRTARVVVMGALFCASLWFGERVLDRDPSAVFYLMPFRVCELSLGSLTFVLDERTRIRGFLAEMLVLAGLAAIALSALSYDESVRFPGLAVLLPCVGTAAVILGGQAARTAAFLRTRPFLFVGVISYSLYLIHWPAITLYKFFVTDDLALPDRIGLCLFALAVATLMHRFIEQPFRRRSSAVRRPTISFATGMTSILGLNIAFACAVLLSDGWPQRYPISLRAALAPTLESWSREFSWRAFEAHDRQFTRSSKVKVFVIGDSQASDLVNLVEPRAAELDIEVASFPASKFCQMPLNSRLFTDDTKRSHDCEATARRLATDRRIAEADIVILAFAWFPERLVHLRANVDALRALGARKVAVLGRKDQGASSIDSLARNRSFDGAEKVAARRREEAWTVNERLQSMSSDFVYLDLMSTLCPSHDYCHVVDGERNPIFFDRRHFTEAGARFVANRWLALPAVSNLFRGHVDSQAVLPGAR